MANTVSLFKQKNFVFSFFILVLSLGLVYEGCLSGMGLIPFRLGRLFGMLKGDYSTSFWGQCFLLALLAIALKIRNEGNYLHVTFQWKDFLDSILLFLAGYSMVVFLAVVTYLVLSVSSQDLDVFKPNETLKYIAGFMASLSFWKMALFLLVNAAFEEGIIRALFMTELNRFIQKGSVVVFLSALVQAGYHLYQGWFRSLLVFLLFLVFASYFQKFRRTTPLVLAHFFVDFLSFGLMKALKIEL